MGISAKRWLHIVGGSICLVGVVFVVLRLATYSHHLDFSRFNIIAGLVIVLLAFTYGLASVMLAHAWWHLLYFLGVKTGWRWSAETYGVSQLAKYVPGNIFHLAGRQALGLAAGLPARPLAKSAVLELGLMAAGGVLYSLLVLPLVFSGVSALVSTGLFVVVSATLLITLRRLISPSVAAALFWQIIFLAVSGMVFVGTLAIVVPATSDFPAFSALCSAYVVAWLAGLLTPGAPAGVGVRELVLLFLLGGQIFEVDLVIAVVLGRLITVTGDLLYFSAVSALRVRKGILLRHERIESKTNR
jgi:hypothetical protein